MSEHDPAYMTVAETAALLRVRKATVAKWCRQDKFKGAFQLDSGRWRIPRVAVMSLANGLPASRSTGNKIELDEELYQALVEIGCPELFGM